MCFAPGDKNHILCPPERLRVIRYPNEMHVSGHRLRNLESIFYTLGLVILNSHNRIDSA